VIFERIVVLSDNVSPSVNRKPHVRTTNFLALIFVWVWLVMFVAVSILAMCNTNKRTFFILPHVYHLVSINRQP
jgi:hypothetical protein